MTLIAVGMLSGLTLAAVTGIIFGSVLVFVVALPAACLLCVAPAVIHNLRRTARHEMHKEMRLAERLETAGHRRAAAHAVTNAIKYCEMQASWDGDRRAELARLRAWHRRLLGRRGD